ncbi:MAG: hypothetical protein WBG36_03165 [Ornithinimicrobium sp.]
MSQHDQPDEQWNGHDLNGASEDELSQMLGEAERALRDIRGELRERRAMAHAGIEVETPRQDLNEARGRWSHFFEFVRQLSSENSQREDPGGRTQP